MPLPTPGGGVGIINSMNKKAHGFTIVELLIVIVIIAILAAITLVAYNGITARATESTVSSDFNNFMKQSELYYVDKGSYPTTAEMLKTANIQLSKSAYNAAIVCFNADASVTALVVDAKNGSSYYATTEQKTMTKYTAGKVVGASGGVICPNVGITTSGSPTWQWLLQSPSGTWSI